MSAILLITLLATGFGNCADSQNDLTETKLRPLATVHGEPVTSDEFQTHIRRAVSPGKDPKDLDLDRRRLFQDFITETILLQNAKREGITVTQQQVREYLQEWLGKDQELTPELFEQAHRYLTIQKLLAEKIRDTVQISISEMLRYYEDHERDFVIDDQAHVLEILVYDRASAEEVLALLRSGNVLLFKETARKRSKGLTADRGGDLGIFQRGQLPPNFEDLVFSLKPGDVSPIFHSAHGFHIFMLEEWIVRHVQRFYEVQMKIFDKLTAQKEREAVENYVNDLLQVASVRLFDSTLQFDPKFDHAQLTD